MTDIKKRTVGADLLKKRTVGAEVFKFASIIWISWTNVRIHITLVHSYSSIFSIVSPKFVSVKLLAHTDFKGARSYRF